QEYRGWMDF
uniref:[Arg4]-Phyllocaerulein n=1 Tax=Phasmahyla jandaia TaxID=762504 RepID=CAER_PHAJA|nr:RecName: Full=[Arg4]-Phyllocaerulein [Phasmahyla jandaia]